ncbi:aminodeoxychorismate synthase component I [Iodobacter fluviatilis]|uniref:Anthranilate synthase component 1 n=1 Tax=Iodobacter fluviatilis TaxID=537 RepID=A0A377SV73_9NEIS|nr:aminodeoxychorismate synthase component I [Iodobacter fluviatilis]TCU85041.1 anthranilate synthase component 1 [Iodobacter fluviatilis]STR45275.1 Para-aminobenzoate synthase component 1 [Iodobacter fluviatilis]
MFCLSLSQTPDLLALHASDPARFPALAETGGGHAGWDILFALPREVRVYAAGEGEAFVSDLRSLPLNPLLPRPEELPLDAPFAGGWFTYAGYELLSVFEPHVPQRAEADFPVAALLRIPAAVLLERPSGQAWLVAETLEELEMLAGRVADTPEFNPSLPQVASITEDDPEAFLQGAEQALIYIREGDVFQVNLSRGWDVHLAHTLSPAELFASLRVRNPAPFSTLLDLGCYGAVVSSSPERLVKVKGDCVETRPIAGTHPRSLDAAEDAKLKERLLATPKERAEHIMLVDLERNDLGRICRPGTVQVDELMAVATYAFVHHIESNVRGLLSTGQTPADILRALFPGGTITGCPKVRCMQIIRELEDRPRYAYTGSLGYINLDGSMDLNILIRTFLQRQNQLYFRAGAGIVIDSDPERELQETRHKARGLLRAIGVEG